MIEFVTLLLGLVVGTQAVEVSVDDSVAMVEIRLDGRFVGGLTQPPWFLNCDFGAELEPRELVAVAYDDQRRELHRIRQWVNVPRDRIEARLALTRSTEKAASARLIWSALDHAEPSQVRVTFDGQALAVEDLEAIVLPEHDPKSLHLLRAELLFGEKEHAYAELVFGGTYGDEVATELTAVVLATDKRRLPSPEKMAGWLQKDGEPLTVVAVERGPVNLLVVRERSAETFDALFDLWEQRQRQRQNAKVPPVEVPVLEAKDRVRFVFPTVDRNSASTGQGLARLDIEQVPVSGDVEIEFRKSRGAKLPGRLVARSQQEGLRSLFGALTRTRYPEDQGSATHPLTDAVVIAGLTAATGDRRRAVVLVRSGRAEDNSRFTPRDAEHYLEKLRVPLMVWTIAADEETGSLWGEERDVSDVTAIHRALADLRAELESQVVVWVEGAHLSHKIELTDRARGLRVAGPRPTL